MRSSQRTRTAASSPGPRPSSRRLLLRRRSPLGLLRPRAGAPGNAGLAEDARSRSSKALLGPSADRAPPGPPVGRRSTRPRSFPLLVKALDERPPAVARLRRHPIARRPPRPAAERGARRPSARSPDFPVEAPGARGPRGPRVSRAPSRASRKGVASPAARSRAASCRGIAALGIEAMDPLVARRLGDDEAAVRLEAARGLIKLRATTAAFPSSSATSRSTAASPTSIRASVARDGGGGVPEGARRREHASSPSRFRSRRMAAVLAVLRERAAIQAMGEPEQLPEIARAHEPDVPAVVPIRDRGAELPRGRPLHPVRRRRPASCSGATSCARFTVDPKLLDPIRERARGAGHRRRSRQDRRSGQLRLRAALRSADASGWRTLVIGTGRREPSLDGARGGGRRGRSGKTRGEPGGRRTCGAWRPFAPPERRVADRIPAGGPGVERGGRSPR